VAELFRSLTVLGFSNHNKIMSLRVLQDIRYVTPLRKFSQEYISTVKNSDGAELITDADFIEYVIILNEKTSIVCTSHKSQMCLLNDLVWTQNAGDLLEEVDIDRTNMIGVATFNNGLQTSFCIDECVTKAWLHLMFKNKRAHITMNQFSTPNGPVTPFMFEDSDSMNIGGGLTEKPSINTLRNT
jgi:hypothetical protein